jgi:hypothetical protein
MSLLMANDLRTRSLVPTYLEPRSPGYRSRRTTGGALRQARSRLAALLRLDNLAPGLIIAVSVAFSLEPRPFGVEISDRTIILALFTLFGVDVVVERTGRLKSLNDKINELGEQLIGPVSASKVLQKRSSFERMDVLLDSATRSILIVGINLEGAMTGLSSILRLASAGGAVKLLAMDPDGACIGPSAAMSRVDPEIRSQRIRQNLNMIKSQLLGTLNKSAMRHVRLFTVDAVLPVSVTVIDQDTSRGWLVAQHHLTATHAEAAPMIYLSKKDDAEWFQCYLNQCMACFENATEWQQ